MKLYRFARKASLLDRMQYFTYLKPEFLKKRDILDKELIRIKTIKQFKSLYIKYLRLHIEYKLSAEYYIYNIPYETYSGLCLILQITDKHIRLALNEEGCIKFIDISNAFTSKILKQITFIRTNFPYNMGTIELCFENYFQQDLVSMGLMKPFLKNTPKEKEQYAKQYLPFQTALLRNVFNFIHSFNIEELSK